MEKTYYIKRSNPPVEAVEIKSVSDHPGIIIDPDGFEPARMEFYEPNTTATDVAHVGAVHKGDVLLTCNGVPFVCIPPAQFAREYIKLALPEDAPAPAAEG